MRKINGIIAAVVLVMFVVHGVFGALNMMNIAPIIVKWLSHTMLALIAVHAVISVGLSVRSVRTAIKTKAPYFTKNRLFWSRRISGLLILALVAFHLTAFGYTKGGVFRLVPFDLFRLVTQILFILSIAVHIITNVKPMLITFGVKRLRPKAGDILFFISAVLLFMTIGFIIYYIRWQL